MKSLSFTIILLLSVTVMFAQIYYASDTLYVFAKSGLNLRSEPNAESKIVTKLKYNDWVIVDEVTENYSSIEQRNGWWVKVNNGKHQGYLFSGYLCRLSPPPPPRDSFELNYHFVEWLESFVKKDSLIHEGNNIRPGSDPDGKDTYGIHWKFYASGTVIYNHNGYEWEDFSFESINISVNDLINYFDFIKGYRPSKSDDVKITYQLDNNEYPVTFVVKNFHDIKVSLQGNTIKVFMHLYDS